MAWRRPSPLEWALRAFVLLASAVPFLTACFAPALVFKASGGAIETWSGAEALGMGWLGPLLGLFGWLANPLALLALLLVALGLYRSAAVCALLACGVSLDTFRLYGQAIPADEASARTLELQALGWGVWAWFASLAVPLLGSVGLALARAFGPLKTPAGPAAPAA